MMKKFAGIFLMIFMIGGSYYYFAFAPKVQTRQEYEDFINNHPYQKLLSSAEEEENGEEHETDRPDLAMMQNFLQTMDPTERRPTPEILEKFNESTAKARDNKNRSSAFRTSSNSLSTGTQWVERGPKQVGGRTRAILFDPNDPTKKKLWAGGVTGGLWYNDDITNASSIWKKTDDFWDNLAVSCIAADPNNSQIIYVGTGELEWTVRGGGIWKTINGGVSWTRLTSTQGFLEIRDIVVRNESGVSAVYAAVKPGFGGDNPAYTGGLYRSVDGGISWQQVLPFAQGSSQYTNLPTDIEIGIDNTIWVGTAKHFWVSGANSTIYKSTTGLQGSWGTGVFSFTGSNLKFTGQIELAVAPSNSNVIYAAIEQDGKIGAILKSTDQGTTWTSKALPVDADTGIPADDFTRGQAWYDLILAVSPSNMDQCYIGGVDLFSSTNGGTNWVQISKWYNINTLSCSVVHADQHNFIFRPGLPNEVVVSNDGGVFYTGNISVAATNAAFSERNLNYNITQFYSGALHPTIKDYMLGGTQDNGTPKFTSSGLGSTVDVYGGDGSMCFIDQKDPNFQIASYIYNVIGLSTNGGASFTTKLIDDNKNGNFINQGDYDSNLKILFTSRSKTAVYRVKNVTTTHDVDSIKIINLGTITTALRVSPYTTGASNLYVGTAAGKLFKVLNANATPTITEITGPSFPNGSISSIAFGASENQIMVTFFNYGVVNIWETRDGGTTWINREGNLPNMPVRWVEYHPQFSDQIYIATELGVWSTDNVNVASPVWSSTNGGLANVRTDMLRIRDSDKTIMAATHGRGVFTALMPSSLSQTISFKTFTSKTFGDPTFKIWAQSSSGLPIAFTSTNTSVATVADSTITIVGGGTTTLVASQGGNIVYTPATSVNQLLTVNKATQTVTFVVLAEKDVNDPAFIISSTATSTLPVTFTSSVTSVATVTGSTVTIVGPGTTVIKATQAGNTNFLPAVDVPQNLVVVTRILQLAGTLDFGDVFLGEDDQKTFSIKSIGTGNITISNITYPAGYTGTTKTTGTTIDVTVTFKPVNVIDYLGNITVESDATSGVNTIAVKGKGVKITELSKQQLSDEIEVYPNPVKDIVYIKTKTQFSIIELVDSQGRTSKEQVTKINESTSQIDVSKYAAGKYFLRIPTATGQIIKQIIKN